MAKPPHEGFLLMFRINIDSAILCFLTNPTLGSSQDSLFMVLVYISVSSSAELVESSHTVETVKHKNYYHL